MNIKEMDEKLLKQEEELIKMIEEAEIGSAERDAYTKELERIQGIRQRNEKAIFEEEKSRNEADTKVKELEAKIADNEKKAENEKKKSKLDFISKMVSTVATFLLGIIILSFEEKGFIRSKVFGWIKFK